MKARLTFSLMLALDLDIDLIDQGMRKVPTPISTVNLRRFCRNACWQPPLFCRHSPAEFHESPITDPESQGQGKPKYWRLVCRKKKLRYSFRKNYLLSKETILRLDSNVGFKAHFSQDRIESLLQLDQEALCEPSQGLYKRNLAIRFDPTKGVIKLKI